jgi:hypothetical protein
MPTGQSSSSTQTSGRVKSAEPAPML